MIVSPLLAVSGSHRSKNKRRLISHNSYIASIAEAEPGFDRYL